MSESANPQVHPEYGELSEVDQEPGPSFQVELEHLLNQHCVENESNTPDFILAAYLRACLDAWNEATRARDSWYSIAPRPGWRANFERADEAFEEAVLAQEAAEPEAP